MTIEIALLISIISVAFVIYSTISNIRRAAKHDEQKEAKQDGVVLTELGYIKSGVDDIKRKQEKQEQQNLEFMSRLTAVEASSKQAHKRLDIIENSKRFQERP